VLTGTSVTATGTNVGATKQTGEPNHGGNSGGASVWYKWTAPATGTATISTAGSNFDTLLGVYKGASVGALTAVASNDDDGASTTSKVTFAATAGVTYQIAVDGFATTAGAFTGNVALAVSEVAAPTTTVTRPANDKFSSAKWLSGRSVTVTASNVNATRETGEPKISGNAGGKSVWFNWTARGTGATTITLAGSTFNTLLGVYRGSSVGALTLVSSNNDAAGTKTSKLSFRATKGVTYRIVVDGYNAGSGAASGSIRLQLSGVTTASVRSLTLTADDAVKTRRLRKHARRTEVAPVIA
jgi:hypothetical protein